MTSLEIWVHDHRDHDHQTPGPIIRTWPNSPHDLPGESYAGWRAHYGAWQRHLYRSDAPDMIGFFAYRYYLWDPSWFPISSLQNNKNGAPGWFLTSKAEFDSYRSFLSTWDGDAIKQQMARFDILQSAPYTLDLGNHGQDIISDFGASGSANDTQALIEVTKKYGFYEYASNKIYHWILIAHWPIFDRMMREMEPLRLELHERCNGLDSTNEAYKARVMDYVMERVYPLWLLKSGLDFKELVQLQGG